VQKAGGTAAFIDAEERGSMSLTPGKLGVKTEDLLISQPDNRRAGARDRRHAGGARARSM